MKLSIIVAAILGTLTSFQVKTASFLQTRFAKPSPTPVATLVPIESNMPVVASPTLKPTSTVRPTLAPQPVSPKPTPQTTPAVSSTPKASPILLPLVSPVPSPLSDTVPPVFNNITGPEDGSVVTFNAFCFPLQLTDNSGGPIYVRYSFDNSGVSDWNQNYSPCYSNVSNGFHFFVVQGKDAAGNMTQTISRNFTVAVPSE